MILEQSICPNRRHSIVTTVIPKWYVELAATFYPLLENVNNLTFFVTSLCSNHAKAQKNGAHRTVFWVQKRKAGEDGSIKGDKWTGSCKYVGDWRDNCKEGFGI